MHISKQCMQEGTYDCYVCMYGLESQIHTHIIINADELNSLCDYVKEPVKGICCIGNERLQMKIEERNGLNREKARALIIAVADVNKEWGFACMDFSLDEVEIDLSGSLLDGRDIIQTERGATETVSLTLDSKDEMFYGGKISIKTPFFEMERHISLEIEELERLSQLMPSLLDGRESLSFCPLGEFIDLTIQKKGQQFYVDGDLSDFGWPMLDYYFHAVISREMLQHIYGRMIHKIENYYGNQIREKSSI